MSKHLNKITIINTGGIEKPMDIPIFLFNMFNDRFILPVSQPFRIILSVIITLFRAKRTYKIFKNAPSPLIKITKNQALKLSKELNFSVDYAFSYSRPFLKKNCGIAIGMFNFFSRTTHGKLFWHRYKLKPPFCVYKEFFDFIETRIKDSLKDLDESKTAILLSAHSLPVKLAKKDSYVHDLEVFKGYLESRFKRRIFLSFQSKLGPVKWLKPQTDELIVRLSKNYKNLIVVPISFAVDNTETIYEMDVIYKELALKNGFDKFIRVECFNDSSFLIEFLSNMLKGGIDYGGI